MIERSSHVQQTYPTQSYNQPYNQSGYKMTEYNREKKSDREVSETDGVSYIPSEIVKAEVIKEPVSIPAKDVLMNVLKNIIAKAINFWNDAGDKEGTQVEGEEEFSQAEPLKRSNEEGDAVSGTVEKESGSMRRFLQRVDKIINSVTDSWWKPKQPTSSLPINMKSEEKRNHNYLLDSYNRSGQYSTLVKEDSGEGKFKAKV